MGKRYPQSFKDRAVRMVTDRLEDEGAPSQSAAIREVAPRLGVGVETLRRWVNQTRVDSGDRPGTAAGEREEIRKLKRENAELRRTQRNPENVRQLFSQRNRAAPPRDDRLHRYVS